MKKKSSVKSKTIGRPKEGRARLHLFMKPEAVKDLDSRAAASTRGKVVETLLANVPPTVPAA